MLAATPCLAKAPPQPPEPTSHPNWGETASRGAAMLKANLYDPASAQIAWTSGFQWGFVKKLFEARTFGWIACGTVNAKNRMGGYVGAEGFLVFIDANGTLTAGMQAEWISTCDTGPLSPVLPEMAGIEGTVAGSTPVVGVADELSKLADLRDKGIITVEEFNAQKAKLLGR